MFARWWNQQRIRTERGKTASTARIKPRAPSLVTVVGDRSPRATMLRQNLVQRPRTLCCQRPSAAGALAFCVDAPGHEQGFGHPWGPKRLEDRVQEHVLNRDLREVPGKEGLVVLEEAVGDLAR